MHGSRFSALSGRWWLWLPLALGGAALLVWTGSWWRARAASRAFRSITVLEFAPHDWFAGGIAEEVRDGLRGVPGLRVTASAAQGKVEGNIGRSAGRVHATLRLTRTADGYQTWHTELEWPEAESYLAGTRITAALAERMGLPPKPAARHHTPVPAAYLAYLEGRMVRGTAHFEEATRLDPEFATAWAWLSIALQEEVEGAAARPNRAMPGARDAAERAVALDPDCGAAHLALAVVKLQYDWDWASARRELDRAAELQPQSPRLWLWNARWLATQGRLAEALAEVDRALALEPQSTDLLDLGSALQLAAGRPDRALALAEKMPDARVTLAEALWLAGQKEKSGAMTAELLKSAAVGRNDAIRLATLAARQGDTQMARARLDEAEDLPEDDPTPPSAYALLAGALGEWDRYFSWAEEALSARDGQLPYLRLSPDAPTGDPRFFDLLARMNLPPTGNH